jgi:hypothetical protein
MDEIDFLHHPLHAWEREALRELAGSEVGTPRSQDAVRKLILLERMRSLAEVVENLKRSLELRVKD